jgi:signal transduction histidine kinase
LTAPSIVRWFGPPGFSTPDLQRRARSLWIDSWPFFAVVTIVLGVAALVEPGTLARRETTVVSVGVLILILHAISRAGRPVLASWILVIGLSAVVTQRAWITGGIHAPVAVFYALFIVMAGGLLGVRGGFATAAACLLGAVVLTVGTANEWLTPRPGAGSPLAGLVFVILAIGLALVLQSLVTRRPQREPAGMDAVEMLVHDLRSPMQVLIAQLEILRDNISDVDVRDIDVALDGATTLNRMTNSLLDVSRFEAGKMPVRRAATDLSALAHSVVNAIRILQPTRDISVTTLADSACRCDPELTRRIVENLVGNAMKHTAIHGRVRVVISGSPDKAYIAVHDEGPGLPPEMRAGIFKPYNAVGLRSIAGFESSGLGLRFCSLAAEAQGGAIRIEEGASGGSVFVVELPR